MPCWSLLGVEICLPSLDDITAGVLTPINAMVGDLQNAIINTLTPMFDTIVSTLTPLFAGVTDAITGFLADPLGSISAVLGNIWGQVAGLWPQISTALNGLGSSISSGLSSLWSDISSGLSGLGASLNAGLTSLGGSINDFLASSMETINDSIAGAGAVMGAALETAEGALLTAFDGMGNAISGIMGGIFSGFGAVDADPIYAAAEAAAGWLHGTILGSLTGHSPMTVDGAKRWVDGFLPQVNAAYMTIFTTNMVAEAVSLGQIDFAPQASYRLPSTAAAVAAATELVSMPITAGIMPIYKRYINRAYQPYMPSYEDLIRIYVKEGYLESHWVELPADMTEHFKELGYSDFWTKRLWGMHWVYPSPTHLYEMLHRTAGNFPEIGVTTETLRTMLKLHDFEPKWRAPLEAISWNTWRIYDIRTDWEMGIEDDETVIKRLVDTGFEPEDAKIVFAIQKMFVLRSEIDRLCTESDTDFIDGWISEDQLRADYGATPYNSYVVELRVARAKLRRDRELKKDLKAALTDRFKKGDVSEREYTEGLSKLGVVEGQIAAELERARAYKLRRVYEDTVVETKGLTEAKYSRAFRVGLVTEDVYRVKLAALKYSAEDINLLVELNTPEKPAPEELKTLTAGELKAAFRTMVMTSAELRTELTTRRYTPRDIDTIVLTEMSKWKEEELREAFRRDIVTEAETRLELERREKTPSEIETVIAEEKAAKEKLVAG